MSTVTTFSADAANQFVLKTGNRAQGISVMVTAASDLGSGTLSLKVCPAGHTTPEEIDTLTVGLQATYNIGADMHVYLDLSGATDPDVTVFVSEIFGG